MYLFTCLDLLKLYYMSIFHTTYVSFSNTSVYFCRQKLIFDKIVEYFTQIKCLPKKIYKVLIYYFS